MNVGKLCIATDGPEDIAFVIHVDNNDANIVNQTVNINSLINPDNINGFDTSGNDKSITDFIQTYKPVPVNIDGKESSQLIFNYVDSGEALNTYDIKVQFLYKQDHIPTYEEAVAKNDLQNKAAEIIAKS